MKLALAALAATGLVSCYSYPSTSDTYQDQIVATLYDTTADFGGYGTFTVAPEVNFVDTLESDGAAAELPADLASVLLEEVSAQLSARGYQEVAPEDEPELGAKITVIRGTVEGVDYLSYWGGYGYYDPYYWGYYYPYAVPVYYEYNTSVAKVDLIDVRTARPADLETAANGNGNDTTAEAPPPPDLRALWTTVIYGVLEASSVEEARQAATGIDQAFVQSPYLRSE